MDWRPVGPRIRRFLMPEPYPAVRLKILSSIADLHHLLETLDRLHAYKPPAPPMNGPLSLPQAIDLVLRGQSSLTAVEIDDAILLRFKMKSKVSPSLVMIALSRSKARFGWWSKRNQGGVLEWNKTS